MVALNLVSTVCEKEKCNPLSSEPCILAYLATLNSSQEVAAVELGPWTECCCCCGLLPLAAAEAAAAAAMLVAAIRSDMLEPTPEDTPDVECLPVPAEA